MVDLPIPSAPFVEAQNVQNRVSADDYVRSADYLGSGIDKLSAGLDNLAVPLAEQAGRDAAAKAVTRNADGSVSVDNSGSSFILGRAGEAYAHAVTLGKLAAGQTETSTAMNNLRQEHMGDPEGFQTAAGAYADSLKAKFGNNPLGASMVENANSIAAQHYNGLVNQKASLDVNKSLEAVNTQITDQKNTLQALARQGGTDTPEFQKASQNLNGLYDQLGTNPLFGVSQEKIDSEKSRATSEMRGEAVVGQVDRDFNKKGKAGAQQELTDKILNNPDLHLGDAERKQLYSWGMSRLQYLSGEQQARVDSNKETVNSLVSSAHSGINVPDEMWDAAMDHTQDLGDDEGWSKMDAARTATQWGRGGTGLSPQQSLDSQGVGKGASAPAASGPATPDSIANAIHVQESGGSATSADSIDGAKGGWQIMSGTFARFAKPGENINNPADNEAVGRRMIAKFSQEYGNDPARVAVAYFSGEGNVAPPGSPTPWKNNARDGNGKSTSGYVQDVLNRLGSGGSGGASPSANGVPFTREQMQENPFLMSEWVQSIAGDNTARQKAASGIGSAIEQGLKNDQMPNANTLGQFFQAETQYPEKLGEQGTRIRADLQARDLSTAAGNMPQGQGQALVAQAMHASQGADIYQQQVARSFQEQYTRQTKALAENPSGESVRRGWISNQEVPAPIDMSNPHSIASGVAQRGYVSGVIASRTQDPATSVFSKAELPQVQSVLDNGTADQKLNLVSALSQLPQAAREETLSQLGTKGDTGRVFAVAGMLNQYAPEVSKDILAGQDILKTDARFGPKDTDLKNAMPKSMPQNDFANQGLQQSVQAAATSYYAKKSAEANDTSEVFNQKRWDDAVDKVTGGVATFRGSKVIGPWYSGGQMGLDSALKTLTDNDLAGSSTGDGAALSADQLKPSMFGGSWKLESAGDGKYRVFQGDDVARKYLMKDRTDANDIGGPFVLDLGAKKDEAMRFQSQWSQAPGTAEDGYKKDFMKMMNRGNNSSVMQP